MSNDASPKPPRWRWALLGLLVVSALTVPTGIVVLQHRLQAQPDTTPRNWEDPKAKQKLYDARLAKAKQIRAEWQPWALKHKKLLRAMLASKGTDFSKLQAVYKISPPLRTGDWTPDTQSGPAKFTWFGDIQKAIDNGEEIRWVDAASEATHLKSIKEGEERLREDFKLESDFIVAQSEDIGLPTEFWVSGRITVLDYIPNPDRRAGQPTDLGPTHNDLVPPFDFLTTANPG